MPFSFKSYQFFTSACGNRFQSWINSGGAENGAQLRLLADDNFEGNMVPRQPELPARIDLF